jgi:hypothetical protein
VCQAQEELLAEIKSLKAALANSQIIPIMSSATTQTQEQMQSLTLSTEKMLAEKFPEKVPACLDVTSSTVERCKVAELPNWFGTFLSQGFTPSSQGCYGLCVILWKSQSFKRVTRKELTKLKAYANYMARNKKLSSTEEKMEDWASALQEITGMFLMCH